MRLRVDVWSDVICPYCWIGKTRFDAALRDAGVEADVVLHAFELDPRPTASRPLPEYLASRFGGAERARALMQRTTATAAADGLDFHMEKAIACTTLDAHRLILHAQAQGRGEAMAERLMRAHFTEGLDLAQRETLLRLAREVGLPEGETAAVLEGDAYTDDVRRDEAQAQAIGIRGVPFFVLGGRYGVSGAQPVEAFVEALRMAASEKVA